MEWVVTVVLGIAMLIIAFVLKKNPIRKKSPWIVGGFGVLMMGGVMAAAGLPEISLTTVSLSTMLVRAALIVWQGVLIAKLIVEEYQNKTIELLFAYPINFKKIIWAKITLICGLIFMFHIASSMFQHVAVFLISGKIDFVTYRFESLTVQLLIMISTVMLGLIPLAVGMINKSTIATVVSLL